MQPDPRPALHSFQAFGYGEEESAWRQRAAWALPLAGLLAAAAVAWLLHIQPPRSFSLPGLFGAALRITIATWAAAAAVVVSLQFVAPRGAGWDARRLAVRTAESAVWCAPAAILLAGASRWALPLVLLLVGTMSSVLQSHHRAVFGSDEEDDYLPQPYTPKGFGRSLSISLAAQIGLITCLSGYPVAGVLLGAIATALLVWLFTAIAGQPSTRVYRSTTRAILSIVLATAITSCGLLRFLEVKHHFGRGHGGKGLQPALPEPGGRAKDAGHAMALGAGAFPGVILWPEQQPHSVLVPPLPAIRRGLLGHGSTSSLSIPFDGQYWFFKSAERRPPPDSPVQRGSTLAVRFHSTDHSPLSMEAHQNFGALIPLRCCAQIQVAIRNADGYPGTVSMEVILASTALSGKPSLSLGRLPVISMRRPRPLAADLPQPDVLTFAIPAATSIAEFDAITVIFHLDGKIRADTSARMEIERFLLVPAKGA